MLVELARPVALLLCILSLLHVFYLAFLVPDVAMEQRIWTSLELMSVCAGICLLSGVLFRQPLPESDETLEVEWRAWRDRWQKSEQWQVEECQVEECQPEPLLSTLPVRLFCWACCLMVGLFLLSWYLETYCILYRDVRRF